MEQKNEQSVYEVMTKYAGEVIAEMAGEIFTTRNFIEAFVDKHEIIYVELLFAAYKNDRSRVFHRVHSQIGAYLSENQEKLDIKKTRRLMTRIRSDGRMKCRSGGRRSDFSEIVGVLGLKQASN